MCYECFFGNVCSAQCVICYKLVLEQTVQPNVSAFIYNLEFLVINNCLVARIKRIITNIAFLEQIFSKYYFNDFMLHNNADISIIIDHAEDRACLTVFV